MSILSEKHEQAVKLLNELDVDVWLVFVRETAENGDPVLPLILGRSLTWQSALLVARSGKRIAIVGNYDADSVRQLGVWTNVIPYVQGVREPLLTALREINPRSIAINYSTNDVKADGLSHGMYLLLRQYFDETAYGECLVSAETIVGALRGRKTVSEVARVRRAVETTREIFESTGKFARPGVTEAEVSRHMKSEAARHGVGLAWDPAGCPIVNSGPHSMVGHGVPSEAIRIEPGHILHIDFGVQRDDFCSDIQRCWYVPVAGENAPPAPVQKAFDTIVRAIQAAASILRPGVRCWEVDAAARKVVTDSGYPEYLHATGHHLGRAAHDGGGVLGPRWERYGDTPMRVVEPGNVFTLELGIENVDGRGYLGLEEDVVVTERGCEFISNPQTTLPLLEHAP